MSGRIHRVLLVFAAATIGFAAPGAHALPMVAVTSTNMTALGWVAGSTATGGGAFWLPPVEPPLGHGAYRMTTGPGTAEEGGKHTLSFAGLSGLALGDIEVLAYSTYQEPTAAAAHTAIALNIAVDFEGNGTSFTTLVFEPAYSGSPEPGTWQTWDTLAGEWWSTRDIPGVCQGECFVAWSDIVASNPDARVLPAGVAFVAGQSTPGAPWAGFAGWLDAVTVGALGDETVYDFEACTEDRNGHHEDGPVSGIVHEWDQRLGGNNNNPPGEQMHLVNCEVLIQAGL